MKEKKQKPFSVGKYFAKHKVAIAFYLMFDLIGSACTVFSSVLLAEAIALVSGINPNFQKAIWIFVFSMGMYALRRLCFFSSTVIYQKTSNKMMAEMNHDVSIQAFKLNSKAYSDNNTGTFVQRMVSEPDNVVRNIVNLVDIITAMLTSISIIAYVAVLNIYIGIIVFATIGLAGFLENYRVRKFRRNQNIVRKKGDKVNSLATEIVRSEKDVKSLGLEDKLSEVSKENYIEYKNSHYKMSMENIRVHQFRNAFLELMGLVMLVVGVLLLEKGIMTLATFMLVYSNHNGLYNLVWHIGNVADFATSIKVASKRMADLFDENEFPAEHFGNVSLDKVKGRIEFKRVDFSFIEYEAKPDISKMTRKERKEYKKNPPPKKIKSTNQIFNKLSFKIKPNTTVAFVGKSGSGKSTILNLMAKMYEVDGGQVLIDGVNINDLDKKTLRNNISLVNQFPYIFDMSIKDNLLLAKKEATDEQLLDCIKRASLSEFIDSLPEGINTKVGESGIKLSGGQKQRLAIARALLRNSPIIIFDESTSSLDNFAQEDIKKSIEALKGQGTIVIVAHRLSTIRNADKIFFIDNGEILDSGTFDELFENNVKFRSMFYAENI